MHVQHYYSSRASILMKVLSASAADVIVLRLAAEFKTLQELLDDACRGRDTAQE